MGGVWCLMYIEAVAILVGVGECCRVDYGVRIRRENGKVDGKVVESGGGV